MKQRSIHPAAFTLIELMISIALVVILMLGITKVFTLTSQTAGATNQISSAMRDSRSLQGVLYQDFATAVTDGAPSMLLCSSRVSAFRNKADELADQDKNPLTTDLNGNNIEGEPTVAGERISPATYNSRSHRMDTFSMFTRQRLERQTGGTVANVNSPLMSQMSATEAWIWYGHLRLPDNNGSFSALTDPGAGTLGANPNNYYATQWVLGRQAILLRTKDTSVGTLNGTITDRNSNTQVFFDAPAIGAAAAGLVDNLRPLAAFSQTQPWPSSTTGSFKMFQSRYDLAATSISDFTGRLNYWLSKTTNRFTDNWWGDLFCGIPGSGAQRFQGNPFVGSTANIAPFAQNFAQQAPILLPGCTQFIVEYAGDFVAQEPLYLPTGAVNIKAGQVTNVYTNPGGTDGQVDFVVTTDVNGNRARKIRWYGLPRDTDGLVGNRNTGMPDGQIPLVPNDANQMADVVPLRDIWQTCSTPITVSPNNAPFERFQWTQANGGVVSAQTKDTLADPSNGTGDYATSMSPTESYICAWGPSDPKPKMIRIIITVDDPASKLADGQTFEYVFTLP